MKVEINSLEIEAEYEIGAKEYKMTYYQLGDRLKIEELDSGKYPWWHWQRLIYGARYSLYYRIIYEGKAELMKDAFCFVSDARKQAKEEGLFKIQE